MAPRRLGILVGGGPAPGINSVIAAATIEAINEGCDVVGIYDGFKWLARGDTSQAVQLQIDDVSRIHTTGGSILRTSRTNPGADDKALANTVDALRRLAVTHLVCIGGDDTTTGANSLAAAASGAISVVAVPKTIDNDLPLPDGMPSFGFETARAVGSGIVESLMEDARTNQRWFVVVSMGRECGALALGICKAAGATLAVIPEELAGRDVTLEVVADIVIGSMIKRKAMGRAHGVAVVAEGIAERMAAPTGESRDAYGHLHLADVAVGDSLRRMINRRCADIAFEARVVAKEVGYELRCAKPLPFDVEYTRTLGYGAVRYLLSGGSAAMIALRGGKVAPVPFADVIDPATHHVRVRLVDTSTEAYEVARKYMVRLEGSDLDGERLAELARLTNLDASAFKTRFEPALA